MKPKLPLNLDHSCWRVEKADVQPYPPVPYGRSTLLCNGPADFDTETKCPACQWLAGYEAATKEKGDSE